MLYKEPEGLQAHKECCWTVHDSLPQSSRMRLWSRFCILMHDSPNVSCRIRCQKFWFFWGMTVRANMQIIVRAIKQIIAWANMQKMAHHVFLVMRCCLIFAARCPIVNESAYTWASGTSMAVPHVAGLAAIYLSNRPQAQPAEVKLAILNAATQNQLNFSINSVLPGTPNLLINSVAVSSQGIVTASQGP